MFVRVNRDEIIEGLQKSAGIIPAKTGAAFLRSIWLEAEGASLKIMSTDSSLEFCGEYPAQVETAGRVGVQGRAFCDLVRNLPKGELVIKADGEGKNVLIEQGRRKYKLPANEPEWFQAFAPFPEGETVFWSGDFLHEVIEKIGFCISEEDSMPKVKDALLLLLSSKTYDDLATLENKILLKKEIVERLTLVLGEQKVLRVYITEIVIQ